MGLQHIFYIKVLVVLTVLISQDVHARKHELTISNDRRHYFALSTFGFYSNGILEVKVDKMKITPPNPTKGIGFSLEKTTNPVTDKRQEGCQLSNSQPNDAHVQHVFFIFDFKNKLIHLNCSADMTYLQIDEGEYDSRESETHQSSAKLSDSKLLLPNERNDVLPRSKRQISAANEGMSDVSTSIMNSGGRSVSNRKCNDVKINMTYENGFYSFKFVVSINREKEEGLYSLNFHNCMNYPPGETDTTAIDMLLKIKEMNSGGNYLSAGQMPLPPLYFMMALLFFLSACFWFFLLKKSKDPVFKIHYLMGVLVIIKSFSLLFHGVNFHFIQTDGTHMEAWAVMYYIMHLLKGALLFTILALIGSGWAFIKHMLSSKERKIFMIIIPLQIIANVATIIVEETEEANEEHEMWVHLLVLLDFLCCGAILLPVVWSIRYLQEASQTDGKAAMNLKKLKLFRHFYIMVVCYIYFTRIIVFLLEITVPFQYEWLYDMFREMATYVFFVMTGYKFRPTTNNPYFKVTDDEEDMDEVLTTTGLTESITRVNKNSRDSNKENLEVEIYEDDEEVNLLNTEESSHDFD